MSVASTDIATVLRGLLNGASQHEDSVLRERALHSGLMWRCPCDATNAYDADACHECAAERLWTNDTTPPRYRYGPLLEDLRGGLKEWFDDRPHMRRPAAVGFRITTEYDDGPAWATGGATAYFTDSPQGLEVPHAFDRSCVADALVEIGDLDQPQTGDRLIVRIPAL
ncbi:hypothetical protein [Streptomyces sp. NPDC097619]|uniref:hypothetical protein n=1 Tax=Streptomyces sp. NPDC097619 TaxID=3157228 RepID=UPI003324350B